MRHIDNHFFLCLFYSFVSRFFLFLACILSNLLFPGTKVKSFGSASFIARLEVSGVGGPFFYPDCEYPYCFMRFSSLLENLR